MTYETIRVSVDGRGVAALTLARPDKHNALSGTMIGELTTVARCWGRIQPFAPSSLLPMA